LLDLILTRINSNLVSNCQTHAGVSDHDSIHFYLSLKSSTNHAKYETVTMRNYKEIDFDLLSQYFYMGVTVPFLPLCESNPDSDIDTISSLFMTKAVEVLDSVVPLSSRRRIIKARPRWFNEEVLKARREVRKYERRLRNARSTNLSFLLNCAKQHLKKSIRSAKKSHWSIQLDKFSTDPKRLWSLLLHSSGRVANRVLPSLPDVSDSHLAIEFNQYFQQKVVTLKESLGQVSPPHIEDELQIGSILSSFSSVSPGQVKRLITRSLDKTSKCDLIPTWLVKKCLNGFLLSITALINRCLSQGIPASFKHSIITPILKQGKPSSDLSSYRPISNLPYIAKLVENIVVGQITDHLDHNNLFDNQQFAYRAKHSCELALLELSDFIFSAADKGEVTIVLLLDMSAAFDTVEHSILLQRLSSMGIRDQALSWCRHYLSNRFSSVSCRGELSTPLSISHGVPQGSVLGPLLFIIYISEVSRIIKRHGLNHVFYADDLKLYTSSKVSDIKAALSKIQSCADEINNWLTYNKLVFNADKTELLIAGSRPQLSKIPLDVSIVVGTATVKPSVCVRDLGVYIDSAMTMKQHVNRISSTAFSYLRVISRMRYCINEHCTFLLIHSLVLSRIDYCISILYGASSRELDRLQKIINYAVRVIKRLKKSDDVAPILRTLEWPNISQRITKRICSTVHKVLYQGKPFHLSNKVHLNTSSVNTRRAADPLLLQQPVMMTNIGRRAFSYCGPHLWNSLPLETRKIKDNKLFSDKVQEFLLSSS
jgi:hypothetical protein